AASLKVAVGDVDGDGFLDAVFANWNNTNTLWRGNSDGTFTVTTQSLGQYSCRDVALADVDADGDFDILFANDNAQGNTVWTNDGTGIFYDSGQTLGANDSRGLITGDFDGDGDLDMFVCNYAQPNRLWINDGHGGFSDSGTAYGAATSWQGIAGDVNGDGALDLLIANENAYCEQWMNTVPDLYVYGLDGAVIDNGAAASIAAGTDFGPVLLHSTKTLTLTLTNASNGDLHIDGFVTNGADAGRFVVTAWPDTIASGGAGLLSIAFTPDACARFSASLSILNNSTNTPFVLYLAGQDQPIQVTNTVPANGAFGMAPDGDVSAFFSSNVIPGLITSERFLLWSDARGYLSGT
ncbi:MAG: VCBS repeat-containing protein, partial [Spartobacteria bacterium]|nr:VCBS repeat-containing protein [Spartobacteria bacterium]